MEVCKALQLTWEIESSSVSVGEATSLTRLHLLWLWSDLLQNLTQEKHKSLNRLMFIQLSRIGGFREQSVCNIVKWVWPGDEVLCDNLSLSMTQSQTHTHTHTHNSSTEPLKHTTKT